MKCEWKIMSADEFCFAVTDGTHDSPKPQLTGKKLITSKHLKGTYIDFDSANWISEDDYRKIILRSKVDQWDILYSMIGTIGNMYMEKSADTEYACKNVGIFKLDGNKDNSYWLYYYLQSPNAWKYINTQLRGSTQSYIPLGALRGMPIIVPSEDIRKKIIDVLRVFDDKIELNNKINENLERQAQTIYHEWFETINTDELPVGWQIVTLGDVAVISKKSFNPSKEPETMLEHYSIPAFDESRFPVFELSTAIKSNKFVVDNCCFMISKLNPTTKRAWRPYCLTENAVCSTEFIVYKAKDTTITDFLYSVIDSASFSDFMCSHVTGSTGSRQRTTPSDTLSFEFVIPSEDKLNSFQALVSPMYEQMRINAIENDKLKRLRDSLLPKLMSGEIDVSNIQL